MPKEIPINQLILSTNYKLNENNRLNDLILVTITAHTHTKKISFPLRISGNCELVIFTEEILNGKLYFLCSECNCGDENRKIF